MRSVKYKSDLQIEEKLLNTKSNENIHTNIGSSMIRATNNEYCAGNKEDNSKLFNNNNPGISSFNENGTDNDEDLIQFTVEEFGKTLETEMVYNNEESINIIPMKMLTNKFEPMQNNLFNFLNNENLSNNDMVLINNENKCEDEIKLLELKSKDIGNNIKLTDTDKNILAINENGAPCLEIIVKADDENISSDNKENIFLDDHIHLFNYYNHIKGNMNDICLDGEINMERNSFENIGNELNKNINNKIGNDKLMELEELLLIDSCEQNILQQNNIYDKCIPNNVTEVNEAVNNIDFDLLPSVEKLVILRKPVKPNHRPRASNPLKTLSLIGRSEYEEVKKIGIAELEIERIKLNAAKGNIDLLDVVKIGLTTKEDFTKIELKTRPVEEEIDSKLVPFKNKMLLQIKGRRMCQSRLVAPIAENINSGECYVLVTPKIVYLFIGKFANIIERNKGIEICNKIVDRKELGVSSFCQLVTIDEKKKSASIDSNNCADKNLTNFWNNLGALNRNVAPREPRTNGEEEVFEQNIIRSTKIYRPMKSENDVNNEELDDWYDTDDLKLERAIELEGKILKYEILGKNKIFIFDFGSELYIWCGSVVPFTVKKKATMFAEKLYQDGLNYSLDNCDPNNPLKNFARPDWTLLGRVVQNGETILFREKFSNWPEDISKKLQKCVKKSKKPEELFDIKKLICEKRKSPIFKIEEHQIGRGHQWYVMEDGIKWQYVAITKSINIWLISDFVKTEIPANMYGIFYAGNCYIVKWVYNVNQIVQTLSGNTNENQIVGRDRCVYFYWQGSEASINDQGATAILTKNMDGEKGVQIHIMQDKEPSCFLSLFTGKMVINNDKKEKSTDCDSALIPLLCVHG